MMFNKIILVGNLTRDIELRYTQSGSAIANGAIATSRKFTVNGEKREEVCFVDITFFGRSAEVANQYLRKGSKILVDGRIKFDQWVDQNGQKRSKHSVVVETMQMLGSKNDNQDNQQQGYQQQPQQQNYQQPQQSYQQPAPNGGIPHPNYDNTVANQTQANREAFKKPNPEDVPVIDLDEDEIPF